MAHESNSLNVTWSRLEDSVVGGPRVSRSTYRGRFFVALRVAAEGKLLPWSEGG